MDVDRQWFESHDNLVTLTAWMAENGWAASEVARAVEKPWSYEDEFNLAMAEVDAELNAEAAARDTAEVAEALDTEALKKLGVTHILGQPIDPPNANDPCPASSDGAHSWEPVRDVPDNALRSGDTLFCEECHATTIYDKHGEL